MTITRLLAASMTAALAAGLAVAASPVATAEGTVSASCPANTYDATYVGGDTFDPTPADGWDIQPAESWAPGSNEAGGYLHGAIPATADGESAAVSPSVTLPAGKTTVLTLDHQHELTPDVLGHLEVGADGSYAMLDEFSGTGGGDAAEYDLTSYAGQTVQLRFHIAGGNAEAPATAGWYLENIDLTACNSAVLPSAARSASALGRIGKAAVSWSSPATAGSGGIQKYTITVAPGGRVIEVGPSVNRIVVSSLPLSTTHKFYVRAHNAAGASEPVGKKLIGTKMAATAPTVITYGQYATIKGKLIRVDLRTGVGGKTVNLQQRKLGNTSWSAVDSTKTDSSGLYRFTRKPTRNMQYRTYYPAYSTKYLGTISPIRTVKVRAKVSFAVSDSTPRVGQEVKFNGSVAPNHAGRTVEIQMYADGRWHSSEYFMAKLNSESKYGLWRVPVQPSTYYFRAYLPAHRDHAAGFSRKIKVTAS